jgi:peptidyl-tRNA hydrolase, PTH1 family
MNLAKNDVMLWVGLGNPGAAYTHHRHNIGFMVMDELAKACQAPPWRKRFQGLSSEIILASEIMLKEQRIILLKPETFMNESGRAVAEAMRFYKMSVGQVTVFHDELDLPSGQIRVKSGGGNAGHNGLRSISALCGNDYQRVRMGIGHPGNKALVHDYVLSNFSSQEALWLHPLLKQCAAHASLLAEKQGAAFQAKMQLSG